MPDALGQFRSNAVAAVRADVERYFAAFTDVHSSIEALIGEDDQVVLRWSTTGTHTAPTGGCGPPDVWSR